MIFLPMGDHMNYVMTLANSIIGVGVLAMPFCFQKCGIILAILMILLSSIISRLSCHFLLKASIYARRKNFEFLAFHALGSTGKLLVELGIIGFLMGTVIAFFVVVGDLGPEIIAKTLNIETSKALRSWLLIFITIGCVLPLGLLRNVDSLTSICTVTIGFYMCLVLKVMVESTKHISDSDWMDKVEIWKPSGMLQCLPIFSMALFCQTQIFEIYSSMENPSLEKMNLVVKWAINMCAVVYILVGSFGYIAFCHQHFSGNILLSFSPTPMSDIIKMGFVLSVAFSFPLAIFPCRASLYSLLFRRVTSQHEIAPAAMPERRFRCLTVLIVSVGLAVAMALPCIELVLGLVGSTMGVAVCVLLPAACYVKVVTRQNNERLLAQIVLVIGILIMVFGTYANLYAMDEVTSNMNKDEINDRKMLRDDFPDKVADKIILVPLENKKIELEIDKTIDDIKTAFHDSKNAIQVEIQKPAEFQKVEEVPKDAIKSPPLPVEQADLTQDLNIAKINEPPLSVEVQSRLLDNNIANVNVEEERKAKENLNVIKNDLPPAQIVNNEPVKKSVEISKDAIRKEDLELDLDKSNLKDTVLVKVLQNTVTKENDAPQNIPLKEMKADPTEGKVIQEIKKEKMQLDNEFQRKVVENMNLIASMSIKNSQNLKTEKEVAVDVPKLEKSENSALRNEQNANKAVDKKINEEVKVNYRIKYEDNDIPQKIETIRSPMVDNDKPKLKKDTDEKKSQEIAKNLLSDINAVPVASDKVKQPKPIINDLTKTASMDNKKPLESTNAVSDDINRKQDKYLQREILQIDPAKTEKALQSASYEVKSFNRPKRDLEHEEKENVERADDNCVKPNQISLDEGNNGPKILFKRHISNKASIDIELNVYSEILKPSSRDLKSIPDKVDTDSQ